MSTKNPESAMQKRDQVLSVKASKVEKDMIVRAAKQYRMSYSEFIRLIAIGACRKAGIEERQNIEEKDVRRRRIPVQPVADTEPSADAPKAAAVA